MLLVRAELDDVVDDGAAEGLRGKLAVTAQCVDETLFPKFFASGTEGFRDAIGVENERVARRKLAFGEGTIPLFKGAHDGGGGLEALEGIISAQEEWWKVATVGVTDAAGGVVIFGEEKSGEGGIGSILAKELIDRA